MHPDRDITQVKNKTASVIASFGPQIKVVNLSGTSVTAQEVVEIILSCPNIQVLKLAHCKALIQPTKLNKEAWKTLGDQFEDDMLEDEGVPLAKLKTLKLKQPVGLSPFHWIENTNGIADFTFLSFPF